MPTVIDNQKSLWFNAIPEADFYNVRVKLSSDSTHWDDVTPQSFPKTLENADSGEVEITLSSITNLADVDDTFDFAISAAEDNGQESDYFIIEGQKIDFLLPAAPTSGGIR